METKKVIIIGGLLVLGLGAYFYFKPKKTGTTGTGTSSTGTTGTETTGNSTSGLPTANPNSEISVPTTGDVISTPEEVKKIALKIADAKALAIKIDDLKTERRKIALQPIGNTGGGFFNANVQKLMSETRTKEIDTQIADLQKLITDLGYAEVNGKITKIV